MGKYRLLVLEVKVSSPKVFNPCLLLFASFQNLLEISTLGGIGIISLKKVLMRKSFNFTSFFEGPEF